MSYLTQLIQLRRQRAALETQEKAIKEQAIHEALLLYRTKPETHKIYQSGDARILLKFVTHKPKSEEHADLTYLAKQIDLEKEKACAQNQSQISALQEQLEHLQQTPKGERFEHDYQALETALTTQVPQLAVLFGL